MAADSIRFQVLDVGQGTGNFIEIYDGTKIVNTILIDLGSEGKKRTAGFASAAYIVSVLKKMASPTIDTVILSHSDSDHINLIERILDAFNPPTKGAPELTINFVRYGCDFGLYKKGRAANVISRLEKYADDEDEVLPIGDDYTDFDSGAKSTPLRTVDGVKLYVVAGNTPVTTASGTVKRRKVDETDGYAINTKSMVVVASFGGGQFVATGDATGQTLATCNENLTDTVRKTFLPKVLMVTMPHHGSATTTFDLKGLGDEEAARKSLETFVSRVKALTITASAERRRTFKHPSANVMSYFWDTLDPNRWWGSKTLNGYHFYTAYFTANEYSYLDGKDEEPWPLWDWWYCVETKANVYTNLYFDYSLQGWTTKSAKHTVALPPYGGPPVPAVAKATAATPLGVAWTYTVTSAGDISLDWIINRPDLVALQAAIDAGVRPEDRPTAAHHRQPIPDDAVAIDDLPLGAGQPEPLVPGATPAPPPRRAERAALAPGFDRIRRLT